MASWFISPLLSGLMSGFLFMLIRHFILNKVSSQTRSVIETPCSCVYFQPGDFFFFMVVVSFKHKTQTVERTSAEIFFKKNPFDLATRAALRLCNGRSRRSRPPGQKKTKRGGSSWGQNRGITSDLSFQLQLPCSEVRPASPSPDEFTSVAFLLGVNRWLL